MATVCDWAAVKRRHFEREIKVCKGEFAELQSVPADVVSIMRKETEVKVLERRYLAVALGKGQCLGEFLFEHSVEDMNSLKKLQSDPKFIALMNAMQSSELDSDLVGEIIQLPVAIPFPKTKIKNLYIQQCTLDFHRMKEKLLGTSKGKTHRCSCMSQET